MGTGAGDLYRGTLAGLVDACHQLAGKGHLLHRLGRLGNHDQHPLVAGHEIGGIRVHGKGLAAGLEAGQDQVAQPQRIGLGKSNSASTDGTGQLHGQLIKGLVNGRGRQPCLQRRQIVKRHKGSGVPGGKGHQINKFLGL